MNINIFLPPVVEKIIRKLKGVMLRSQLMHYLAGMSDDNPLKGLPVKIVGDAFADPTEFFTHYEAYSFWVANKLQKKDYRILDVGSPKMLNAMLSASHSVTALVLSDCSDRFSNVTYINHDISSPLPFPDNNFDRFTSTVSLPLVGLGRYGDKVDPNCLHNFVSELKRCMTKDAELYVSMCLGPNFLAYNNGWYFSIETINKVFSIGGWHLEEAIVDRMLSRKDLNTIPAVERFIPVDEMQDTIKKGDYRVVFCRFRQKNESHSSRTSDLRLQS